MKLNKGIALITMAAAASTAYARMAPFNETKTICLSKYERADGSINLGSCDLTANNIELGLDILENGCAADQAAITAGRYSEESQWSVSIRSCLPPNVVQL